MSKYLSWMIVLLLSLATVRAAEPPDLMNFQGVLRDSAGQPLDGSYDVVFAFHDADVGGSEILLDAHTGAGAITVTGGLFNVPLGSGAVSDGGGPGTYVSLADVFRDHDAVWLELRVGGETLSPRIRVAAAAYAFNSMHLGGRIYSEYLDTSSTPQNKAGAFTVDSSSDPASTAIQGLGGTRGGYFESDQGAFVQAGAGPTGVSATGSAAGAHFENSVDGSVADIAYSSVGIFARGAGRGGRFEDLDGTSHADIAFGDTGVEAHGTVQGGLFTDIDDSGVARLGYGHWGVQAWGDVMGGYFYDRDSSGYAYAGWADTGIAGFGNIRGGYFDELDGAGRAEIASGHFGINASGEYQAFRAGGGGRFEDRLYTGEAYVAHGNEGIYAEGAFAGAEFRDKDPLGAARALVAWSNIGIAAYGIDAGGFFQDDTTGTWTYTAVDAQSTAGPGVKNFVQNHPYDPEKVVVYTSLEGDHPGTFTRGSGRTKDGRATLALGKSFRLVTNPDIGLTAHVTPRGAWSDLYVESVSTEEIVVVAKDGGDAVFDYVVYGLRIGFEGFPAVQPKPREARLPAMDSIAAMLDADPELRATTALARFQAMRTDRGLVAETDLSRAEALKAAIGVFDPALHAESFPEQRGIGDPPDARTNDRTPTTTIATGEPDKAGRGTSTSGPTDPLEVLGGDVIWLPVSESVEPGDLLVLDPTNPGRIRRGATMADPHVVAVAVGPSRENGYGVLEAPVADGRYATVKADAGYGEIRPGDRLVASPTPGHAMRSSAEDSSTVLGKALDGLATGTGKVRVLLTLR